MFIPHMTRWLRMPGILNSPEPVWLSLRDVIPEVSGIERCYRASFGPLVHTWLRNAEDFRSIEQLLHAAGISLLSKPRTFDDRVRPLMRALEEEKLWIWRVRGPAVSEPAVFPVSPASHPLPNGGSGYGQTPLGTLLVRVIDEIGQPLAGVVLEFDRNGQRTNLSTDGSGIAKMDSVAESFASVRIAEESPVRAELRSRWENVRALPWVDVATLGEHTEVVVLRNDSIRPVSAFLDEPHTLVLEPRVVQILLHGMWFETSKCFLLPSAVEGARFAVKASRDSPSNDLLIVGHTDPTGEPSYNDPLSLERAEATIAYMRNDVEAWYAWYAPNKAWEKRWGSREDLYMIEGIAMEKEQIIPLGLSPVRWYQSTRGLTVDGIAGPITRHALIREYMELTGTTLDPSTRAEPHGCGENFPRDGATNQDQRFVEAFLFENPIAPSPNPPAILPPPPGKNSSPGSKVYPEWLLRARETLEHAVPTTDLDVALRIGWESDLVALVPADMVFELKPADGPALLRSWPDAVRHDGYVELVFPGIYHDVKTTLTAIVSGIRYELWIDQVLDRDHYSIEWLYTLGDFVVRPTTNPETDGSIMSDDWHDDPFDPNF